MPDKPTVHEIVTHPDQYQKNVDILNDTSDISGVRHMRGRLKRIEEKLLSVLGEVRGALSDLPS